jgi:7,8-dihydropterin-6-yl-methyl-4-(beta-D-ribofuranosyl)aminobenzene 5'-phosphate synthase
MKITVLTENTTQLPDFRTEHGLSLFIETGGHRILFDTGQSDLFLENADKLGIDLRTADIAVISHGHYDHGGGLSAFMQINDHAPVYLSRYAFEEHLNRGGKYIGLDPALADSPRITMLSGSLRIADGVELFSGIGCSPVRPIETDGLSMRHGDSVLPEDFRHELYMLVTENSRRILFSGCSHRGILNIVNGFSPDVLVGGFHFMNLDLDENGKDVLNRTAEELLRFQTVFYTCHCTGRPQYDFLKEQMGSRLHYLSCGQTAVISS